jgi:periplasmic protein TonB
VFDRVIESGRPGKCRAPWRGGAVALLAHVAIGGVAVWATLSPRSLAEAAPRVVIMSWPDAPRPASPGPFQPTPGPSAPIVDVPVTPPVDLPPLDARAPFDARPWLRDLREAVSGSTGERDPGAPWSIANVETLPALLAGPRPVYPEALRRAGIAGRVVVEAVIDTLGRAEPGSVRIIETPNPGFDTAARDHVLGALFRPARVNGRPVRVLVRVPVEFALRPFP